MTEIQRIYSWMVFKHVFWDPKKVTFILFERTRLKNKRKRNNKKKEIEQKKYYKKG